MQYGKIDITKQLLELNKITKQYTNIIIRDTNENIFIIMK